MGGSSTKPTKINDHWKRVLSQTSEGALDVLGICEAGERYGLELESATDDGIAAHVGQEFVVMEVAGVVWAMVTSVPLGRVPEQYAFIVRGESDPSAFVGRVLAIDKEARSLSVLLCRRSSAKR